MQIDTDEVLHNDVVDDTVTVSTASSINTDAECKEKYLYEKRGAEQCEMEEIKRVTDEVLKVHGVATRKKVEGVTRVIYENPNGFNSLVTCNEKLEKAKEIIDELEADVVSYSEHRLNCKHKDNRNGFSQIFRGREANILSIAAHNVHENVEKNSVRWYEHASIWTVSRPVRLQTLWQG